MSDTKQPAGITGRDGYIIAKALAIAIASIPHLPNMYQPKSDRDDMLMLLRAGSGDAQFHLDEAAETMSHLASV